ncbi:hypothetical protein GOP47_0011375 [Adiantum capillus-veneris]|uniref:Uncharacterized protein n=1 Tax=Adiantum capillus-veneris TaxID=13818 RepID=A0A9D4UTV4_ADICA|nr:hypothetical protein GOP47_0011375 [Adiantum capillus-veneris]
MVLVILASYQSPARHPQAHLVFNEPSSRSSLDCQDCIIKLPRHTTDVNDGRSNAVAPPPHLDLRVPSFMWMVAWMSVDKLLLPVQLRQPQLLLCARWQSTARERKPVLGYCTSASDGVNLYSRVSCGPYRQPAKIFRLHGSRVKRVRVFPRLG